MRPAPPDHAGDPPSGAPVVNIANGLTVLRILAVPLLGWLLWRGIDTSDRLWASVVFVLASLTDLVDGALARRLGIVTTFGKIADPIADKALTAVALIGLSAWGLLPWWVTVVILLREALVTGLRFWVIEHGVIPASRGGKAKTVAQMVAITMFLIPIDQPVWHLAAWIVMAVALLLTVATGIDYVVRALSLRRRARVTA